jgi:PAS domain S-box-containing protein
VQAPLRVLIVEDVPVDAELMSAQLRREGHSVDWTRVDTEAAFRAALDPRLDVILSDCRLPSFSASLALKILRDSGLDVPLILVSGTIGEEAATELMRQGAADYVLKDRVGRLGMAVSRAMAEAGSRRDRARSHDDLLRAEARFRALFESNVIGIIVADPAGRILEANSYFLSMVGRSPAELPLDWVAMTPEKFISRDREVLKDLLQHGHASPWEKEFLDRDGNGVPTLMGSAQLADGSLVCFVVDLTPMKAVQTNLEQAKSQLEDAINQIKQTQDAVIAQERLHALGQMAAGIAHDFNNYLSPIIGLSELILTRPRLINEHEKVLKFLRAIHQAGLDAALVVRRLREYYGTADPTDQVEVIDLKQVVEQTIELTQSRWGIQSMSADAKYRITTSLIEVSVAGRASELRQMLVNLIFNALDAMPNGGELGLRIELDADRPGIANLEVKDTGTGMTAEVRKRCLEPFFTTKGAAGTGLGLATAYGIVKRHRGEIQITSEPGHGTCMSVSLPTVSAPPVSAALKEGHQGLAMHILVIDDEEAVRDVIKEYLLVDGHKVDLADGPSVGLRKINSGQYDLIITDRSMPEMSGDQLALQAKRMAPHVPILMLTGFGDLMIATGEHPDGVDAVVGKPITIDELRAAIARVTAPRLQVPDVYHSVAPAPTPVATVTVPS